MRIILALALSLFCVPAFAQSNDFKPGGDAVVDQAYRGAVAAYSDTTKFAVTRGFYNGNATACDVGVVFNGASTVITLKNVPSGATLPFQVVTIRASETTCAASAIILLY